MHRNYDGYGRRRANGRIPQQQQVQQAFAQLQQELAAWKQEAKRLENEAAQWQTAVSQQNKQLQQLEQQIAQLQQDNREQEEKYNQPSTDYEATKKRLAQRFAREADLEKENLLRDMLPVADNLERALTHVTNPEEREGIALTLKVFTAVLNKNGVQKINAQDQPFDPNLHEAVSTTQASGKPTDTIIAVTENGYTINDKLLRPARVIVTS